MIANNRAITKQDSRARGRAGRHPSGGPHPSQTRSGISRASNPKINLRLILNVFGPPPRAEAAQPLGSKPGDSANRKIEISTFKLAGANASLQCKLPVGVEPLGLLSGFVALYSSGSAVRADIGSQSRLELLNKRYDVSLK